MWEEEKEEQMNEKNEVRVARWYKTNHFVT
jgi:hypothetical protein